MIVNKYGAAWRYADGMEEITGKSAPAILMFWAKPKKIAAPITPSGFHLPKIIAAIEINPWPAMVVMEN